MHLRNYHLLIFLVVAIFLVRRFDHRSNVIANKEILTDQQVDRDFPISEKLRSKVLSQSGILSNQTNQSTVTEQTKEDTSSILLIYVYADTHKHAYGNLKYFIETAVREQDGIDYVFILQNVDKRRINVTEMPKIPKTNAFYIQHDNECFDFGTFGWFFEQYGTSHLWTQRTATITNSDDSNLHNRKFDIDRYKYFILMNSSVRGPYFPPYFLKFLSDSSSNYWYHIFTKRINDKVKLVGCTISCDTRPHIQSYFLVTDQTGLGILLKSDDTNAIPRTGIFGCYASKADTISISEVPSSARILDSGYMIESLLAKYQSIDFSAKANYTCNSMANPGADKQMDGITLDPYEAVFVKFSDGPDTKEAQEKARLYQQWMKDTKLKNRTSW